MFCEGLPMRSRGRECGEGKRESQPMWKAKAARMAESAVSAALMNTLHLFFFSAFMTRELS